MVFRWFVDIVYFQTVLGHYQPANSLAWVTINLPVKQHLNCVSLVGIDSGLLPKSLGSLSTDKQSWVIMNLPAKPHSNGIFPDVLIAVCF